MAEVTAAVLAARAKWRFRGLERPSFADDPGPGQESVWDYPRPPKLVADRRHIRVMHGGRLLAESTKTMRVSETASPPTFYMPPEDVDATLLHSSPRTTFCEWKGVAREFDADDGVGVAWCYFDTFPEFEAIAGRFSFYPARARCTVDGEAVRPQPGGYYGGWLTDDLAGPFKGAPGSESW